MRPERWAQVNEILHRAMELAPAERPAFLTQACASDEELRREVESLLAASEDAGSSFLRSAQAVGLNKGTRLGDYEVQSLLGSGGMGEVYRARDLRLRRDVAIKVLPAFVSSDPERLRRFEQEALATAALNHPNILAVYQMGSHEGVPYLVTELLDGETLREKILHGRIAVAKAIDYAVQVARGLAAAHEKGIVHRDLKPENLFITRDGRLKILDFGLAKLTQPSPSSQHSAVTVGEPTEPGIVMGTVGYMAPEQVRGQPTDHRTDIFSFGAVLYEMLSGQRAFQKPTSAETMTAILNEEPPPVSQFSPQTPPALQRLVARCLEKAAEQRFQSASDMAFALGALSDASSSVGQPLLPTESRVNWKWFTVITVLIASAVVLGAWWLIPPAVPVVESVTQLTDDGIPKGGEWDQGQLVTDGSRIYFNEGATGSWNIAEVAVTGGQTALVPTRLVSPQLRGIAADHAALLALVGTNHVYSLWTIPLPAGEPRRLGAIEAQDGALSPNGDVIFARGTGLYVADKDGSNPRIVASNAGNIWGPTISPDGRQIAFNTYGGGVPPKSLFEVETDGSYLHTLVQATQEPSWCCPRWTADGKDLIFRGQHQSTSDLWVIPAKRGIFARSQRPLQLTNGPPFLFGRCCKLRRQTNLRDRYKAAGRTGSLRYEIGTVLALPLRDLGGRHYLLAGWAVGRLHLIPRSQLVAQSHRRQRATTAHLPSHRGGLSVHLPRWKEGRVRYW